IAAHAPDLHDVLERGIESGWEHVCLDGTLVSSTRCRERSESGHDLWYSGKHRRHGGNAQGLTDPTGYPVWISQVAPGSVHDITAARRGGILGALYQAAAGGMPTLADKGYTGAGIGIHVPAKGHDLDTGTRCRNTLLSAMRASAERANALLKTRWKALQRISYVPGGSALSLLLPSCFFTYKPPPGEKTSVISPSGSCATTGRWAVAAGSIECPFRIGLLR